MIVFQGWITNQLIRKLRKSIIDLFKDNYKEISIGVKECKFCSDEGLKSYIFVLFTF